MDLTTIIGIVVGFALIINGIALDTSDGIAYVITNLKNFADAPSAIIVVGGTYIDTLVDFAQIARKNGLLALEEKANQVDDPFFKQGLMLIVDATDADRVKEMLNNDLDNLVARHDEVVGMYERASSTAPAFGMIGTLVGLINMLKSMNLEDSSGASSLGASMSVALVTTFYGCILANLIFNPIATKLRIRHSEEELCKTIIIEGVLSIQAGENPKFLKEKLISFLPQRQRELASEESGE